MFDDENLILNSNFSINKLGKWLTLVDKEVSALSNGKDIIKKWFKLIKRNYDESMQRSIKFVSPDAINDNNSQQFQYHFELLGQTLFLHLDVSTLRKLTKNHSSVNLLSLSQFSIEDIESKFTYTPTNFVSSMGEDNTPIVIVPFEFGLSKGFVADGNHRLTARMVMDKTHINAYIADPITSCISLTYNFDKSIFGLILDISLMRKQIIQQPFLHNYQSKLYDYCLEKSHSTDLF